MAIFSKIVSLWKCLRFFLKLSIFFKDRKQFPLSFTLKTGSLPEVRAFIFKFTFDLKTIQFLLCYLKTNDICVTVNNFFHNSLFPVFPV